MQQLVDYVKVRSRCLQIPAPTRTLSSYMKLEGITGNNIELTPAIEEYMRTRIQKLSKIVQNMEPATIRAEVGEPLSQRGKGENVFYAELNATIQDEDFRGHRTDPNVFKAIEKVRVDMYRQIIRWKTKGRSEQRKMEVTIKRLSQSDPGQS